MFRENVGLLAMTKIGSRRVIQISAAFMIFFSIFGKFFIVVDVELNFLDIFLFIFIKLQENLELFSRPYRYQSWRPCTASSCVLCVSLFFTSHLYLLSRLNLHFHTLYILYFSFTKNKIKFNAM